MRFIRVFVLLFVVLFVSGCDLISDIDSSENSELISVPFEDEYTIEQHRGIDDISIGSETIEITYYIGSAEDVMLTQLTTPILNTGGLSLTASSSSMTEEFLSQSIGGSMSTTVVATVGVGGPVKAEVSVGFTAEISQELTLGRSQAESQSESYSVNLSDYKENLYYTLILTGNYDIYQTFVKNLVSGEIESYIFTKATGGIGVKVVSNEENDFNFTLISDDVFLETIDFESIYPNGDGSEINPYIIETQAQFTAMYFDLDANYKLANNLSVDMSYSYTTHSIFTGTFDGDGYSLEMSTNEEYYNSGKILIDLRNTSQLYNGALFSINEGVIKNLIVSNLKMSTYDVETGKQYNHSGNHQFINGGIVGKNDGVMEDITILNSNFVNDRNNSIFGSFAGVNTGIINNCQVMSSSLNGTDEAQETIIYSTGDTGGIAGRNLSGGTISNSSFIGQIHIYIAGDDGGETLRSWGGIVGYNSGENSTVSNVNANVYFEYYGENSDYHRSFLGIHSKCNLQIKVGTIIGHQDKGATMEFATSPVGSNQIYFINGNFHNGSHEKEYLFSYEDGKIGRNN